MGMFDTIYVKAKLPLTEELNQLELHWDLVDFQTKDLENCLSTYTITEDGRLMSFNDAWWEENSNNRVADPVSYHGGILFYHYLQDIQKYDWWIDFKAYFIYGKLDKIELVHAEKTPTADRLARQEKWKTEMEQKEKTIGYKMRRILRKIPGYSKTMRILGKGAYNAASAINTFSIRWS
jgi:hypothetical protein